MIGNWEDFGRDEPTRYFEFATSYLKASKDVCIRMNEIEEENSWPNASVTLMLAAHSVELFIKGALILRGYKGAWGHTIDDLYDRYKITFPEECFHFNCPFVTEYVGFTSEEIVKKKKTKRPQASVVFRYPINKPSLEWDAVHGFETNDFLIILSALGNNYNRLKESLNGL
tara:strand:- start:271 stop:783 length:513 start_codon:yes stop_codon:yes gene_type:complete